MDEYLWNKTGSDPEIEQLEAALKGLAYRPTAPPVLPAKKFAFTPRPRSFFRLSLSFASALVAIAALGPAWVVLRNEPRVTTQQAAVKTDPEPRSAAIPTDAATPPITAPPNISPVKRQRRHVTAPRPPMSNNIRPQTLVLTKEEADAYRQLMTALSITSTNLKIVKDKLDGTE